MAIDSMNGLEKAAVLLHSLPAEIVEKVLYHMDPRKAGLVKSILAKVQERPDLKEVLARVLDEAAEVLDSAKDPQGSTSPEPSRNKQSATEGVRHGATSAPRGVESGRASKVNICLSGSAEAGQDDMELRKNDPLRAIAAMPPALLTQALESEGARTISLLMNALDIDVAGHIYKRLTPEKRREVSKQFPNQPTVNEDLLRHVAQAVLRKCDALPASAIVGGENPDARDKRLASLLRNLDRADRIEMIAVLEESDAALAVRIKERLYQFDDILRMENASVQKLLTEIDMKSVAMSLSGALDVIRDKLFNNLSKRAQDSLKEEIELSGKVPSAKVSESRKAIAEAIQRLDQRGELLLIE